MGKRSSVRLSIAVFACALALVPSAWADPPNKGELLALSYNVAGLPQGISSSDPETNSPQIGPKLNAYDLVLLQEDWGDPLGVVPLFFHEEVVAEANHRYRSEPAPAPLGTDLRRFPSGPPLIADGLNRLSRFPFGERDVADGVDQRIDRQMWERCHGEFAVEVVEAILKAILEGANPVLEPAGLDDVDDELGLFDVVDGGAADCGAQKGFSVATTTFADRVEVDVYNLHGEAGSGAEDRAAREHGFRQLARYINDSQRAGHPIILTGDANLHTAGPDVRPADRELWAWFLEQTALTDVCAVVDCGDDGGRIEKFAFRSSPGVEIEPLSHSFERETFVRSSDGKPLSDHPALAVRFAWRLRPGLLSR